MILILFVILNTDTGYINLLEVSELMSFSSGIIEIVFTEAID